MKMVQQNSSTLLHRAFIGMGIVNKDAAKDEARVKKLIEKVGRSSPLGKQIIKDALDNGATIELRDDMDAVGTYFRDSRSIALNKHHSDAELMSTLVHEAKHADQELYVGPSKYSMYTSVAIVRAKEADAMVHQCAAAYQMRMVEPEAYLSFAGKHPKVMLGFQTEFESSKDMKKALNAGFKAWYDDKTYVGKYDNRTILGLSGGSLSSKAYKTELSGDDLSAFVRTREGASYVEAGFFTSQRATTVTEKQAEDMREIEKNHIRNTFRSKSKVLTSADRFYVRKHDGQVIEPKIKTDLAKYAVLSKKVGKGR